VMLELAYYAKIAAWARTFEALKCLIMVLLLKLLLAIASGFVMWALL